MEKDVSVRQQAVDLLYAMCDKTNAEEIVQEMLNYLETADYSIREEMVGSVFFVSDFSGQRILFLSLTLIPGSESGHISGEVCYRLHLVRRRYIKSH